MPMFRDAPLAYPCFEIAVFSLQTHQPLTCYFDYFGIMVATLQYKIEGFKFIKKDKHRTLTNGHWQKAPEFAEEKITKLMNTGCPGDDVVLCLSTMVAFKWMFTHLVEARMRRGICLQRILGLIIGKFLILQVHAI